MESFAHSLDVFIQLLVWYRGMLSEGDPECLKSSHHIQEWEVWKVLYYTRDLAIPAYIFDGPEGATSIIENTFRLLNGRDIRRDHPNVPRRICNCDCAEFLIECANGLGLGELAESMLSRTVCEGRSEAKHLRVRPTIRQPSEVKEYIKKGIEEVFKRRINPQNRTE